MKLDGDSKNQQLQMVNLEEQNRDLKKQCKLKNLNNDTVKQLQAIEKQKHLNV